MKRLEDLLTYISCKKNTTSHDKEDYVMNYGMSCIFLAVILLQLKDTAAEADGDRNLIKPEVTLTRL